MDLVHPETLSDGVVELRRWHDGDLAAVSLAKGWAREDAEEWLARQQNRPACIGASCAIAMRGESAIGYVGLIARPRVEAGVRRALEDGTLAFDGHRRIAGIGYWVAAEHHGQGFATRSVLLMSRWGLTVGGLVRIEALMDPRNPASRRVAEKAGFQPEGHLRSYLEVDGKYTDALVFSLLVADLPDSLQQ